MTLTVADIMTREVFAVTPETSLLTTARLFASRHISGAPVIDEKGSPIGVVSQTDLTDPDRDRTAQAGTSIFYRVTDHGRREQGDDSVSPDGVVADVMSPYLLTISPEGTILDAIRVMVDEGVHRLLVTDGDKLVGIVTSTDVMRAIQDLCDVQVLPSAQWPRKPSSKS